MFVLGNMLLIYELANYLINFLENFKLDGIDDILQLSQKELEKISTTMQALQKLKLDADSPEIDAKVKEQVISNLNDREKSLELFKEEWDKYIAGINDVQSKVGSLKDKIPTLKLIRDNAQNQLDFFEIMKIFGIMMVAEAVRKNLDTLEIVTLPLDEIELISLPPHKVHTLIRSIPGAGNQPDWMMSMIILTCFQTHLETHFLVRSGTSQAFRKTFRSKHHRLEIRQIFHGATGSYLNSSG